MLLQRLVAEGPPAPPEWVAQIPLVGPQLADYWGGFAHDTARLVEELRKLAEPARRLALSGGTTLLAGLLQLSLSILIAFFFFRDGDAILARLRAAGERIAGDRARRLLAVATETTRGVVLGILGTALVQGILMGLGAWMAGIDAAPLLGFLVFLLSPVPVGPPLIWGGAAALLMAQGETGWGIFMLVWGAGLVSTVDNIIRPLIISHGGALPFILVLIGIIGGILAFGFIGVFLGPVLIAVGFMLVKEWAPCGDAGRAPSPPAGDAAHPAPGATAPPDRNRRVGARARSRPPERTGAGELLRRPRRSVTRLAARQIALQNATLFGPAPSGTQPRLIIARLTERSMRVAMVGVAPVVEEPVHRDATGRAGRPPRPGTSIQNAAPFSRFQTPGQLFSTNWHSFGSALKKCELMWTSAPA